MILEHFDKLFLYVPFIIPGAETQINIKGSIKNSFLIFFESRSTDRKAVDTKVENKVDIGSAQNPISPKHLIASHQTAARIGVLKNEKAIGIFDNLNVTKYHVDNDGVRYARDDVCIDYASKGYVDHYRHFKRFHNDYAGEELFCPFRI